jgi:PAS domain S-box-containing protein
MSAQPPLAKAAARRRWTIRAQLVALVLAVTVPAAGLLAYVLAGAAKEARDAALAQVAFLASSSAGRIEDVLRDGQGTLDGISRRSHVRTLEARNCDPLLEHLVATHPGYESMTLRDRNGRALCSSRPDPVGAESARFPWFAQAVATARPGVSDAWRHPRTGRWVAVLHHPLTDDAGQVAGVLGLSIDLRTMQDQLFGSLPPHALVSVLDRRNTFLLRSIDPDAWVGRPLPPDQAARAGARRSGETFETTGVDGIPRYYAVATVPSSGWKVFAALPAEQVLASQRARLARTAGLGAAVFLVALALAYGIGSAIARPIGRLARAAAGALQENGRPFELAEGSAEVEAVAAELGRLAAERERQRGERAALVAHYERLLKSARDIYLLVDGEGRIADFNDAALEAYGRDPEALRGLPLVELRAPECRPAYETDWRKAESAGGGLFDTVHLHRDGSRFPVEVSTSSLVIDGAVYRQAFIRDITARKAAEDTLRQQNAELDRFNRAAVGRELDMIELKRRINALSRELGREPPYPLGFLEADDDGGRGAP